MSASFMTLLSPADGCTFMLQEFDAYIQDALLNPVYTPQQRRQLLVDWEQVRLFTCAVVQNATAAMHQKLYTLIADLRAYPTEALNW